MTYLHPRKELKNVLQELENSSATNKVKFTVFEAFKFIEHISKVQVFSVINNKDTVINGDSITVGHRNSRTCKKRSMKNHQRSQ